MVEDSEVDTIFNSTVSCSCEFTDSTLDVAGDFFAIRAGVEGFYTFDGGICVGVEMDAYEDGVFVFVSDDRTLSEGEVNVTFPGHNYRYIFCFEEGFDFF